MSELFDEIKNRVKSPARGYDAQFKETPMLDFLKNEQASERMSGSQIPGFEVDKYSPYLGDTFDPLSNIDERRAQSQSTGQLLKGFAGQLATESTLGMGEVLGYALDFEEWTNAEEQAEEGFDNWFSKGFREAKERIQEDVFPVYRTQRAAEGSFAERLGDGTFWASQGKTIGTTLSLMGPSALAAIAASTGAGALGAGAMSANLVGALTAASMSRKAESAMEANNTFQTEYDKYIQEGKGDEEARQLAGESASSVFKHNALMLPVDIMQWSLGLKALSPLKKSLDAAKATRLGKALEYGVIQPGSEAVEEGFQFMSQEEAVRKVREGIEPFGEGFGERMSEYMTDPEFQESAFMGAVTGGIFGAGTKVAKRGMNKVRELYDAKTIAANFKDEESFNSIDENIEKRLLLKSLNTDKLDDLAGIITTYNEGFQADEAKTEEDKKKTQNKTNKLLENIEYVKKKDEEFAEINPEFASTPKMRKAYALLNYENKLNNEELGRFNKATTSLSTQIFKDSKDFAVKSNIELNALRDLRKSLKGDRTLSKEAKQRRLVELDEKINSKEEELKSELEQLPSNFNIDSYAVDGAREYGVAYGLKEKYNIRKDIFAEEIAGFTKQSVKEVKEKEAKLQEEQVEKMRNVRNQAIQDEGEAATSLDEVNRILEKKMEEDALKVAKRKVLDKGKTQRTPIYTVDKKPINNTKEGKPLMPKYPDASPHLEASDVRTVSNKLQKALEQQDKETDFSYVGDARSVEQLNGVLSTLYDTDLSEVVESQINGFLNEKQSKIKVSEVENPYYDPEVPEPTDDDVSLKRKPKEKSWTGNIMEYEISKEGKVNYEEKEDIIEDPDFDNEYINNPDNSLETSRDVPLQFEVYKSKWNSKELKSKDPNLQILGVYYDEKGKRHPLTMLGQKREPWMSDADYQELQDVRKAITEKAKEFFKSSDKKLFKSEVATTADKTGGIIMRTKDYRPVTEIKALPMIGGKKRLLLGVVRQKEGMPYLYTPGVDASITEVPVNARLGATMMWVAAADGTPIPVRTMTKNYAKIKKDHSKFYNDTLKEIRELLSESDPKKLVDNLDTINRGYFNTYVRIHRNSKGVPVSVTFTKKRLQSAIEEYGKAKTDDARTAAFNKLKDTGLNEEEATRVIEGDSSVYAEGATTKNLVYSMDIGNTDKSNPNSVMSSEFETFLGDLEYQVDRDRINTETTVRKIPYKYNDEVAPLLSVNIPETRVTHSPFFNISSNVTGLGAKEQELPKEPKKPTAPKKGKENSTLKLKKEEIDKKYINTE